MATKQEFQQRIIQRFRDETGKTEVNMDEVVEYAISNNLWKLPEPKDPRKELTKEFAQAARVEMRYDQKTLLPYRANHMVVQQQGEDQLHLWVDIDKANRKQMYQSLGMRREQMVSDGVQLTLDQDHWNRVNSNEEPINLPMDLTPDIEWIKNAKQKTG